MKKYIVVILIIILILLIIFLNKNYNEYYEIIKDDKVTRSSTLPKTGIRQGTDPLEGKLFSDVKMYISDNNLNGELGLEKCIKVCKGMCVEYGITNDAYCFPEEYAEVKKKDLETIQTELKDTYNTIR